MLMRHVQSQIFVKRTSNCFRIDRQADRQACIKRKTKYMYITLSSANALASLSQSRVRSFDFDIASDFYDNRVIYSLSYGNISGVRFALMRHDDDSRGIIEMRIGTWRDSYSGSISSSQMSGI